MLILYHILFCLLFFCFLDFSRSGLGVISLTDVARVCLNNISEMDQSLLDRKIIQTKLGLRRHFDASFTVKHTKTAGDAFHKMNFYHHDSLAVVDG